MSDVLRAVDLSKRFRSTVVLDGLNIEVPEGGVYALVGTNGAGHVQFNGRNGRNERSHSVTLFLGVGATSVS
jgi:ABC-type branched-subunit amino acid transport system ATPase component